MNIQTIIFPIIFLILSFTNLIASSFEDATNKVYAIGYRTPRAYLSKATWDYAQKRCGQISRILLLVDIIIEIVIFIIRKNTFDPIFLKSVLIAGAILLFILILIVEIEISSKFDAFGNKK